MATTDTSNPTDVPSGVPEDRVDALYGLTLDEFISAQDALAQQLRKDGERDAAEWVKGLRKPSTAACAANQLARTQGPEAQMLQAAGEAMRAAQEALLAGRGGADALREAAEAKAAAVGALVKKAEGMLDGGGHPASQATLERVRETLEAVALDEKTLAAFARGRVMHGSRPVGLGLGDVAAFAPASKEPRRRDERPSRDESAARKREELRRALKAAKQEERTQRRTVHQAERQADGARRSPNQAHARLEESEGELGDARARYEEATQRLEELERALERLA